MQPSELLLWVSLCCVQQWNLAFVHCMLLAVLHGPFTAHTIYAHFLTGSTDGTDASVLWCCAAPGWYLHDSSYHGYWRGGPHPLNTGQTPSHFTLFNTIYTPYPYSQTSCLQFWLQKWLDKKTTSSSPTAPHIHIAYINLSTGFPLPLYGSAVPGPRGVLPSYSRLSLLSQWAPPSTQGSKLCTSVSNSSHSINYHIWYVEGFNLIWKNLYFPNQLCYLGVSCFGAHSLWPTGWGSIPLPPVASHPGQLHAMDLHQRVLPLGDPCLPTSEGVHGVCERECP